MTKIKHINEYEKFKEAIGYLPCEAAGCYHNNCSGLIADLKEAIENKSFEKGIFVYLEEDQITKVKNKKSFIKALRLFEEEPDGEIIFSKKSKNNFVNGLMIKMCDMYIFVNLIKGNKGCPVNNYYKKTFNIEPCLIEKALSNEDLTKSEIEIIAEHQVGIGPDSPMCAIENMNKLEKEFTYVLRKLDGDKEIIIEII